MTLPKAKNNEKTNKQHITISVTDEKLYYIDKANVEFSDLEKNLLAQLGDDKEQTVVVRIPFNLQVQDLVEVLEIGVKNNLKFVIATDAK